jgi:hypothetical protein
VGRYTTYGYVLAGLPHLWATSRGVASNGPNPLPAKPPAPDGRALPRIQTHSDLCS